MTSEAIKIARINNKAQTRKDIIAVVSNPAFEFIAGIYAIEQLYSKNNEQAVTVKTVKTQPSFWGNPFWIFQQMSGTATSTTTSMSESVQSTEEQWAKNALMWIIISQQLAPVAPQLITSAGNLVSGVGTGIGGLLGGATGLVKGLGK